MKTLSGQKPRPRSPRAASAPSPSDLKHKNKGVAQGAWAVTRGAMGRAGHLMVSFPKITLLVLSSTIALFTASQGLSQLQKWHESLLPEKILVTSDNVDLARKLETVFGDMLANAKKDHTKRSDFLTRIQRTLLAQDSLDDFRIRAGLDRQMHISLTTTVPALLLEANTSERYVVSQKMKVLGKLTADPTVVIGQQQLQSYFPTSVQSLPALPRLLVSDVRFIWTPRTVASLPQNLSKGLPPNTSFQGQANLVALGRQTLRLVWEMNEVKPKWPIEKYFWKPNLGFGIIVKTNGFPGEEPPTTGPVPAPTYAVIVLGDEGFRSKVERLRTLSDAPPSTWRNQSLTIDLNFSDRFLVKPGNFLSER